ncbi:hypothetical protein AX17_005202 [Amanita inopinata Kibby_2008]|nr:hypothetical protein AX17_005202 [Amanita inopinata Kibby_2008]
MASLVPKLPVEIIGEIAEYLPSGDVLNLSLASKLMHDISIGKAYHSVTISSVCNDLHPALKIQKLSMKCVKTLLADARKRQGVEVLTVRGLGMLDVRVDDPNLVYPEPYDTQIKQERREWTETQPIFNQLVNALLSGDHHFPRLKDLYFDTNGLTNEVDTECFLTFLKRHPEIRNVIVEGDNTKLFNTFAFSRLPSPLVCDFTRLERVVVYGPLLPLLLGFTFSSTVKSGEFGPLLRVNPKCDSVPLMRVHLCWPQRVVRVVHAIGGDGGAQIEVDLDLVDVLKALASVCKDTLQVLIIGLDDNDMDGDVIDLVTNYFPNLRELQLGPDIGRRIASQARCISLNAFLRRMAEKLERLPFLEQFVYSSLNVDSDEAIRFAHVLEDKKQWQETSRHFAHHSKSLKYMKLYSLTWRRCIPRKLERMPRSHR